MKPIFLIYKFRLMYEFNFNNVFTFDIYIYGGDINSNSSGGGSSIT